MNKYNICCLTYGALDELAKEAVRKLNDPELEVTFLPTAFNALNAFDDSTQSRLPEIQERAEVFVASGSNRIQLMKLVHDTPVVQIWVGYQNYFHLIAGLIRNQEHRRIGIVTYQEPLTYSFRDAEELLGIEIVNIVWDTRSGLTADILDSGCTAIIGNSFACETANRLGIPNRLVYPGVEVIQKALLEAKDMAEHLRREKKEMLYYEAVIGESPNGIISIDHKGVITNYNPSAERYLGVSAGNAKGQPVSRIFPELDLEGTFRQTNRVNDEVVLYRNRQLHLRKILMKEGKGTDAAATALITDLSDFRKSEFSFLVQQRATMAKSGFVSKYCFDDIVGSCPPLQEAVEHAKIYAKTDYNVLIYGETGTGKELMAQSVCSASERANQSFVAVNCGAIPDNLLESELFGYKEGAFTGSAKGGKRGLFELANGGTIFLDEISSISPSMQVKLLRVLQEREIMRVGDDRLIPVDVRVISASNRSYDEMIADGFRRDLLFRLNELEVTLPPLRERGADVVELFRTFLRQMPDGKELDKALSQQSLELLECYSWPGNIRELHNVCARFSVLAAVSRSANTAKVLRDCIGDRRLVGDVMQRYHYSPAEKNLTAAMFRELTQTLKFNKEQISELLGISRTTLWRMEKEFNGGSRGSGAGTV